MTIDYAGAAVGFAVLLLSLTIHEAAHAWTADRLGDPTARRLGRVSLNPLAHIDWIGTVLLPLIAMVQDWHFMIGWAKPVPVATRNLRHPRRDFMLVAAAGPISNLLQAAVFAGLFRIAFGASAPGSDVGLLLQALYHGVRINVLLAFFNLLPVPPLDGGNVLLGILPPRIASTYGYIREYGFVVLVVLMFTGFLANWIIPPTNFVTRILVQ